MASVVDNPVVLGDEVVSAGNFHGQALAYAADLLASACADVAAISERRVDRLLDPARSRGLPAFLSPEPGLNSGLMITQYTAAAMVASLRHAATPFAVQSAATSAGQEDHVSMGYEAALRTRRSVGLLRAVLAIEVLERRPGNRDAPAAPSGIRNRRGDRIAADAHPVARRRPHPQRGSRECRGMGARPGMAGRARRRRGDAAMTAGARPVRAPHGNTLTCGSWQTEAPLRCLMNNLDPAVAEDPDLLVVYGGTGRAARSWECFDAIVATLRSLRDDETLLVQSGKPVGVARTHEMAPRVLIANSLLVPRWATWEEFWRLEALGLTMYGQMTAGSWIYIGTQGILQGTFETFEAVARKRFGGSLSGRLVVTSGLGGMGGAQPLAVTMSGGVALCIDVDPGHIQRRLDTGYVDEVADTLDAAVRRCDVAREEGRALSVAVCANAAEALPALLASSLAIDVVTDQTSAHDPLNGYIPAGLSLEAAAALRASDPDEYMRRSRDSMARHCEAMVEYQRRGAEVFDYGNSLRDQARIGGFAGAFSYPGFVPAYIRDQFCEGRGPFRWVALSGDPEDIARTDAAMLELFPDHDGLHRWLGLAKERVQFQGLPARICWLGAGERHLAGLRFNDMVRSGELSAPVVIGRDHLDSGSVASPMRETEAMRDGSDAIADWPVLNALLNTASGATWVAVHHGGGVGMGLSIHAGAQVCADGTELSARRCELVLTNDPSTGVMRHADAGYPEARDAARERGVRVPMLDAGAPGA